MTRCKNCGVEMGPEETCIFATYRMNIGGQEIMVCCQNCASELEQAAQQAVAEKPVEGKARPRRAPKKRGAKRKAPRKKAPGRKAGKKARPKGAAGKKARPKAAAGKKASRRKRRR